MPIRDVPFEVRDAIAEQAGREGRSLQAYRLRLIEREARMLQNAAGFKRTEDLRVPLPLDADAVVVIREVRDDGFETDRVQLR